MASPSDPVSHLEAVDTQHDVHADVQGNFSDTDSALGLGDELSTASISSSILKHREENGRTYHTYRDGKYVLPNDEDENNRLDLQHHMYTLTYGGKLLTCDIDPNFSIQRVLDVGTGTGIWALDYADEHPEATVIGVDLSPIQPLFVATNVKFEIDDLEEEWTFSQKFDLIHSRMMTCSFANWPRFFDQVYANLNPGGYFEISDLTWPVLCDDGTMQPDCALLEWSLLILSTCATIGRPVDSALTYKSEMERVGFIDIVEKMYRWPVNRWPRDQNYKQLGFWTRENLKSGLSGISLALFTRVLGMTTEEVEVYLINVRRDIMDTNIHSYIPIYTFSARKPL